MSLTPCSSWMFAPPNGHNHRFNGFHRGLQTLKTVPIEVCSPGTQLKQGVNESIAQEHWNAHWPYLLALAIAAMLTLSPSTSAADSQAANPKTPQVPTIEETSRADFIGSERARQTVLSFPSRGARSDFSIPPKTPQQTVESFKLMDGLKAEAILHEPEVTQPLFLNFDERGRMWVVQFIQYPYPAGLKIVDFDDQFHAVYNKVPPAPPNHDRGADRITIHEDANGDGRYDTYKVFVEGLNMATSVERGRGGVWVLTPPYLIFYPDKNNDDAPDGPPTVHLAGFGLEDTHSAANSLRWGPDGWLYGGQGSGVSATIKRPGLDDNKPGLYFKGQVIWRYHPDHRIFELFSEGGGNTFGLEFDAEGRAFSGINGNNHRGFYFLQGAYYSKNFGEHGYLTNPYAFGYFSPMSHDKPSPRFSHTFVIYEAHTLGDRFAGKIIAPVPLHNQVVLSELISSGSGYSTRDLGVWLESSDRWFRPVDIKVGPDGAIYIADWYDTRLTHMDPRDTWDRQHGRIYRITSSSARPFGHTSEPHRPFDLSKSSSAELVDLLAHSDKWVRQAVLRLLADRRDASVIPALQKRVAQIDNPRALDALWALHAVGGFTRQAALDAMKHPRPSIRMWAVRLSGDAKQPVGSEIATKLAALARNEPNVQVRSQLASTAKRLPGDEALPVIFELAKRSEDAQDPQMPLLVWWALEDKAISHRQQIVATLRDPQLWSAGLLRHHLLPRLARRYASYLSPENQEALAALLRSAPNGDARSLVMQGLNEALKGRGVDKLAASLDEALNQPSASSELDTEQLALGLRRGESRALTQALGAITRENPAREPDRIRLIELLGDTSREEAVPALLGLLRQSQSAAVRSAALNALGRFSSGDIADELLTVWSELDTPLRRQAVAVLCSRKSWTKRFLGAVGGSGTISKQDVPDEAVDRIRLMGDAELRAMTDRFFGKVQRATSEEKQKQINALATTLQKSLRGDAKSGKAHFAQRCSACHKLFGEGGDIGPDLTGSERTNLDNMLLSIVDPNAGIREGYTLFQILTTDERDLIGFITDRDGNELKLRDPVGRTITIALNQIQKQQALSSSMMPEGLLDDLTDQQLRDLFAYLTARQPPPR